MITLIPSWPQVKMVQNQALTKFHIDSSENMIERQKHAMEFFKFLVSNDEWYSSLNENDVWENPHHDRETAVSLIPTFDLLETNH